MNVPNAPVSFDGTLADLCSEHLEAVLPPREAVAAFHLALAEYCAAPSPLFIVRHVAGTTRAKDLQCDGGRFRPSDNSPAWWVHDLLFKGTLVSGARQLATLLESAPCHMFQAASVSGINKAGWHVAHIFNTKDRQTDYSHWTRSELRRRFIRNLHPANCFYVPKAGWQRYGGDRDVLAFAAAVYRDRYGLVWREFLDLADARDLAPPSVPADRFRYAFGGRPVAPRLPLARGSCRGPLCSAGTVRSRQGPRPPRRPRRPRRQERRSSSTPPRGCSSVARSSSGCVPTMSSVCAPATMASSSSPVLNSSASSRTSCGRGVGRRAGSTTWRSRRYERCGTRWGERQFASDTRARPTRRRPSSTA